MDCIPFVIYTTNYPVKFGDSWCFSPEAMMQKEIDSIAQRDPSAPRVSIVHHIFQHEHLMYAIIESIETIQVSMGILVRKGAAAVLWLRRQPVLPGCRPQPSGTRPCLTRNIQEQVCASALYGHYGPGMLLK